jgi:N-acetylneuraminic acid mutarotase
MSLKKYALFFFLILMRKASIAQTWSQIADFPSTERDDGTSFVIGNKAYCGTGLKPFFIASNDMYAFDMDTETWSTIQSLPAGSERQYASGFSHDDHGFIFGGSGSSYFNDLWMYDTSSGNWQAKAPMPSAGRMGASSFVINDTAYIVGGRTSASPSISEVWAYCILTDTWVQKNNLPFGARWRAAAATNNNKGYLIFGRNETDRFCKELFEYNPSSDSWTLLSIFPGNGRTYSAMNYFAGDLVLFGGLDSLGNSNNDLWRINPGALIWQSLTPLPDLGRRGGMCFNSNTAIYYTTGIDQMHTRLKETWKFVSPVGINESIITDAFNVYPNPTSDIIDIETGESNGHHDNWIWIYNYSGLLILKEKVSGNKTRIDLQHVSKGLYFVQMQIDGKVSVQKFIKE